MRAMAFGQTLRQGLAPEVVTVSVGALGLQRPNAVVVADAHIDTAKTASILEQAHNVAVTHGNATLIHQLAVPFLGLEGENATVELHTHTADYRSTSSPTRQAIRSIAPRRWGSMPSPSHSTTANSIRGRQSYVLGRGRSDSRSRADVEGQHAPLLNFEHGADRVRTFDDHTRPEARSSDSRLRHDLPGANWPVGRPERHAPLFDAVERNAMFTRQVDFNVRAERWARTH